MVLRISAHTRYWLLVYDFNCNNLKKQKIVSGLEDISFTIRLRFKVKGRRVWVNRNGREGAQRGFIRAIRALRLIRGSECKGAE